MAVTKRSIMRHDVSRKDKLIKRLRYLWSWELFDSFFIPAVVLFYAIFLRQSLGLFTLYSTTIVTLILWQGAAYWRLKLRAVQSDAPIGRAYLRRFARLKRVNWILLVTLPVVLGVEFWAGDGCAFGFNFIAGSSLYVLAFLEQINYYYYQLMYDYGPDWRDLIRRRKLKKSSLRRALERLKERE